MNAIISHSGMNEPYLATHRIIKSVLEAVEGVQFVQIAVERKRATVMGLELDRGRVRVGVG
jgi:hypothetical protein